MLLSYPTTLNLERRTTLETWQLSRMLTGRRSRRWSQLFRMRLSTINTAKTTTTTPTPSSSLALLTPTTSNSTSTTMSTIHISNSAILTGSITPPAAAVAAPHPLVLLRKGGRRKRRLSQISTRVGNRVRRLIIWGLLMRWSWVLRWARITILFWLISWRSRRS